MRSLEVKKMCRPSLRAVRPYGPEADPWSPLRKSPESCGKAGKPLSSFLFPVYEKNR
jgi:hypothetical protein